MDEAFFNITSFLGRGLTRISADQNLNLVTWGLPSFLSASIRVNPRQRPDPQNPHSNPDPPQQVWETLILAQAVADRLDLQIEEVDAVFAKACSRHANAWSFSPSPVWTMAKW
jgi:hypothetical protein